MVEFELFEGQDKKWYWRMRAGNGRVIADSGEGYASDGNAKRAIESIIAVGALLATAPITYVATPKSRSARTRQTGNREELGAMLAILGGKSRIWSRD